MIFRHLPLVLAVLCLFGCRRESEPPDPAPESASPPPTDGGWRSLSGQWQQVEGGQIEESGGVLRLEQGYLLTGARWQGQVPQVPFEFEGEARRVLGSDFFFSLTFPGRTAEEAASLIVGGWGGGVTGISSIDGLDAAENETMGYTDFDNETWYAIRLKVTETRIEAWIDDRSIVDVSIEDRSLSLRPGPIEACAPFGVATFATIGEMRGMRWKPLTASP